MNTFKDLASCIDKSDYLVAKRLLLEHEREQDKAKAMSTDKKWDSYLTLRNYYAT
jgi:hypothetical protein